MTVKGIYKYKGDNTMEDKKAKIRRVLDDFLEEVLTCSEKENCIDYFRIEINNHKGKLQMDFQIRKRDQAY